MNHLSNERTPLVIAAEINTIKYQMEKMFIAQAIEIGRRLKEAKDLVPYGEWGTWLEESVNYSRSTAQRFMLLFDSYGNDQLALPEAGTQSQTLNQLQAQAQEMPNLTSSQAMILLGLPKEDRAKFLVEMDAEGMSTRELKKAVEQWQQAGKETEQAIAERDQVRLDRENLRKDLEDEKGKTAELTGEREKLKAEVGQLKIARQKLEQEIENKQAAYNKIKERASYKEIERMGTLLTEAHGKAKANRVAFLYETLDRTFKELEYAMSDFAKEDAAVYALYREKVNKFLVKAIEKKM